MAIEPNAAGDYPEVDPSARVHETAAIIGNVTIGARVFVGPQATVRADEPGPDGTVAPITIGEESNVQDGVVIHSLGGARVQIGVGTSIAHGAVVHGPCEIGRDSFIGFNTVVYDATLGERVVVMHGACIESVQVAEGLYVPSTAAVRSSEDVSGLEPASQEARDFAKKVRQTNTHLATANPDRPS